jgi:hypothetical protein
MEDELNFSVEQANLIEVSFMFDGKFFVHFTH